MTDIVERLRWEDSARIVKGLPTEAADEIERLRALVRSAYSEGFSEGMNEHTKFQGGKPWQDSRSRAALESALEGK